MNNPSQHDLDLTAEIRAHQQLRRRANRLKTALAWLPICAAIGIIGLGIGFVSAALGLFGTLVPVILVLGFFSARYLACKP
jgi:hypothetical protein